MLYSIEQSATGQPETQNPLRILIAGVGNVLRQDDGFGIAVVHRLLDRDDLPTGVTVVETGIAGIKLVQDLLDDYDVLIIVDAMRRDGTPGQLYLLEAEVPDVYDLTFDQRHEFLADMHYTNPTRAMMLAKAIDALPPQVYILGCQPAAYDDFDLGLSPEVEAAIPKAVARLEAWIAELNSCTQRKESMKDATDGQGKRENLNDSSRIENNGVQQC